MNLVNCSGVCILIFCRSRDVWGMIFLKKMFG